MGLGDTFGGMSLKESLECVCVRVFNKGRMGDNVTKINKLIIVLFLDGLVDSLGGEKKAVGSLHGPWRRVVLCGQKIITSFR